MTSKITSPLLVPLKRGRGAISDQEGAQAEKQEGVEAEEAFYLTNAPAEVVLPSLPS